MLLNNILPKNLNKKVSTAGSSITDAFHQAVGDFSVKGSAVSKDVENLVAEVESSGIVTDLADDLTNKAKSFVEDGEFSNIVDVVAEKVHHVVGDAATQLKGAVGQVIKQLPGSGTKVTQSFTESFQPQPDNKLQISSQQFNQEFQNILKRGELPSLQSNVLENFVSCNYQLSLGVLSNKELSDPEDTYIKNGQPATMIIKSGGGTNSLGDAKVMTSMELGDSQVNSSSRVEFFIEDLELKAPISPNPKSRTANQHLISFKVIEPYSMGQFLEALTIGAKKAGYQNYIGAPFVLMIDWVGYLENGQVARIGDFAFDHAFQTRRNLSNNPNANKFAKHRKRFLPMQFATTSFTVNQGGGSYDVQAYPYNHFALMKSVVEMPGDYEIAGETVSEILQTGVNSLTSQINTTLLKRDADNKFKFADEYVIMFPHEGDHLNNGKFGDSHDSGAIVERGTMKTLEEFRKSISDGANPHGVELNEVLAANSFDFETWTKKILGVAVTRDKTHELFKDSLAADGGKNINNIGNSRVQFSFLQKGNTKNQPDKFVYDKKKEVYVLRNMQIPKNGRTMRFTKGTSITDIIEEVVIQSEWGRTLRTKLNEGAAEGKGIMKWFRIEPQVFNIPVYEVEATKGHFPKLYVYKVIPYSKHTGVWQKSTARAQGVDEIKKRVVKNYQYLYTGGNKDILDFDIQFNYRFLTGIPGDLGATSMDRQNPGQFANTAEAKLIRRRQALAEGIQQNKTQVYGPVIPPEISKEGWKSVREMDLVNITKSGMRALPSGEEDAIARSFHEQLINHSADMMVMKLTIWGDPYFISDSGYGNYQSKGTFKEYIDENGQMDFMNKEIFIHIDFQTGFDYGDDGIMKFPKAGDKKLEHFSGVYRVAIVISSFNNGKFQQELTLIRVLHQNSGKADDTDQGVTTDVKANKAGDDGPTAAADNATTTAGEDIKSAFQIAREKALAAGGGKPDEAAGN